MEYFYEVEAGYSVEDFLITTPDQVRHLEKSANARSNPEKLLLRQSDDSLDLALYIDASVLLRLDEDQPMRLLHRGNLADFLLALEGVSHFLYVLWNARYAKAVSLLELELQAEIDKFILAAYYLQTQNSVTNLAELHSWLFNETHFDPSLNAEEYQRYYLANFYAGKYCRALQQHYRDNIGGAGVRRELRRFYRLARLEKLDYIKYR